MSNLQISAIFFVVGIVAVIPVLYYHYRKNPHPRFRPPFGEMLMLSLFALVLIGGGSYFMGTLLSSNPDFSDDGLKNRGRSNQTQQPEPSQQDGGGSSKKESKNPFGF